MSAPTQRQNGDEKPNAQNKLTKDNVRQEHALRIFGQALAQNRLEFAYQPVVSARNAATVAYYESLARIRMDDGEVISAATFVPDLEHHDICRLLDVAALRNAVSVIADQRNSRIAVNLSAASIGDQSWLDILRAACDRDPICGDFLIVEITESAFLDLSSSNLEFLYEIRKLGASIAIDDFGAGHTSIGHLGKFRFDFLKIDKSFLKDFEKNEGARYLIQSMINIARHFEMVSIIEGVEEHVIGLQLAEMGADCLQGYAYGRPAFREDWNGALETGTGS